MKTEGFLVLTWACRAQPLYDLQGWIHRCPLHSVWAWRVPTSEGIIVTIMSCKLLWKMRLCHNSQGKAFQGCVAEPLQMVYAPPANHRQAFWIFCCSHFPSQSSPKGKYPKGQERLSVELNNVLSCSCTVAAVLWAAPSLSFVCEEEFLSVCLSFSVFFILPSGTAEYFPHLVPSMMMEYGPI